MSGNKDMNGWIRQAMTPKHALETFVGLLHGQDPDQEPQDGTQGTAGNGNGSQTGGEAQDPPRRRVNSDAGEGQGPDAQPEAGGSANQVMNRLLKDALRNKGQS